MKIAKYRWFVLAAVLGLLVGANANPTVTVTLVNNPISTNCGTYAACNVYNVYTGTINPICCSIASGNLCQNYQIDQWQCAAGGTLYRNFRPAGSGLVNETCGGTVNGNPYLGCH